MNSWLLNGTHLVWLDAVTKPVNNPVLFFIINSNIVLYFVTFINYLWISIIGLKSTEKNLTTSSNRVFFTYIFLIIKS